MKGRRFGLILAVLTVMGLLALAVPAPTTLAQGAWYGEYFANPSLAGGPLFTRYDDRLGFSWGGGSPGGGLPADNFSVRWTRDEWFEAGTYRFSYRSDDGIRIWVGGGLVVNDCQYTYAWERRVVAGPTAGATTFEVTTRQGAMVGEVSVTSAGQSAKVGLYVRPPGRD